MSGELATLQPALEGVPMTVAQLKSRLRQIQDVMKDVMQRGVDYGVIPGTGEKPTLYKPGAEKLAVTFRLRVPDPIIEEIPTPDGGLRLRLRVAIQAHDGSVIAVGVGEASSNEEKYKWRAAVCAEEFDETLDDQKRKKWKRGRDKVYAVQQIRTQAEDLVNTVLKMAHKRAYVHGVIMSTGASSIFTQDVEDLPEEIREASADEAPPLQPPQRKSEAPAPSTSAPPPPQTTVTPPVISEPQAKRFFAIAKQCGHDDGGKSWLKRTYGLDDDRQIPRRLYDQVVKQLQAEAHA